MSILLTAQLYYLYYACGRQWQRQYLTNIWHRDDREWLFTFSFPRSQFSFPWDFHWAFRIPFHSHSQTIVSSLRHKHFLAYQRLKPNTQCHTVLSVLCLSLNLKFVMTVIITEHHKLQKIYAELYSTLAKNSIFLFLART